MKVAAILGFAWMLSGRLLLAADPNLQAIPLPPLRIDGQPARAHTQGLVVSGGAYYVTARRDDTTPRQALLLRTSSSQTNWDVWPITPSEGGKPMTSLDHPGGMDSDGTNLWIPIAESKPKSRSVVCAFAEADIIPQKSLRPVFSFPVNDHIGAVAVNAKDGTILGASWDTKTVYVWGRTGSLKRTLSGLELGGRGLGPHSISNSPGVAVQDWKFVENQLFASGLLIGPLPATIRNRSRLVMINDFLDKKFRVSTVSLPLQDGVEVGREGMAIWNASAFFLPEDLGQSNRLFRLRFSAWAR